MSRRGEWVAVLLILLLAAALRFGALGQAPPGLCHDEVANWLIARDILDGNLAIYFTAAYGHEPLYQYLQAATVTLFGDHWLGLRYPSAAFGLLGLAAAYVLIRRLFGVPTGLLTAAWLAVSFWPLFYARVGLRAIALPFTAALCAYFLLRAVGRSANRHWLFAGLFLGLSIYTYMAARVLPLILLSFLMYLFLVRQRGPVPWRGLLAFLVAAAIVSAPLALWLATHPGAEARVAQVQEPLTRLLAGDPSLVWRNAIANLKFFTLSGDAWPRQNVPGRPVFAEPVGAALFYAGLLIALCRWRDYRYGFLLIWLVGALAPSVVTADAPSSIRNILGLVVVFVFPALALVEASKRVRRFACAAQRSGQVCQPFVRFLLPAACCLLLAPCLFLTVRDYFIRWPQNEVVRFDYQADLTAVAHRLDELPAATPVVVAGLSVHSMDGPGLELAARRDVRHVRLCDTRETLVIPAGESARLLVPQVVPLDGDLRQRLLRWGVEADARSSFASYRLSDGAALRRHLQRLEAAAALPDGASVELPVSFEGRLSFVGYERLQQLPAPGERLALLTYWRVEQPPPAPLKIFVHLLDESDTLVAQHDGLGSPRRGWAAGDLIVQKHLLPLPADLSSGLYRLQLGLYNAPAGPRLRVFDADRLLLAPIEIGVPEQQFSLWLKFTQ